ncbi:cytochrome c biogenesis heme-transporting ATPase CcmA [Neptunicella marina]|uniref:Cytochrome c biogenesis heme-transporting ATPase CcmA n=1 Tax=Neptunicella marina TaxID=2125989 RepID=A0A8J6IQ40_9ALTE|nr:cytochrome c biogenesis heme-transporting ATPase CcmA [Neptunicella marina]MBC3764971.1 cytochrome c biogenesis heme-transporting ATPase CcmA [Neptunicella marina]
MLDANNLTCCKSDRVLFQQLSLSLDVGDILHLQGPNGAGKTSLLRILVGLSQPQSGCVNYQHTSIEQSNDFAQQLIYIGHKPALNPALTAIENLTYWAQMHGVSLLSDIWQILSDLGLAGLEDIPVSQLSAGQQRRVALARLWIKPAKLWVLDEPFTALDVNAIDMVQQKMQRHAQQGGAVILTSHQPVDMMHNIKVLIMEYQWL